MKRDNRNVVSVALALIVLPALVAGLVLPTAAGLSVAGVALPVVAVLSRSVAW